MEKISNVPFYNCNVSLKGNSPIVERLDCSDNKSKNYSHEYMSSDVSSAVRAYGLSFINKNKTIPQMSLKDMIKWFESQGKIEGKDFEIDSSYTMGNTVVILKNKQGQNELTIHYDCGNHDNWNGYEVSEYNNGVRTKEVARDYNGNISYIAQIYDKQDENIQHLINELSYDITPQQYVKYLKDNNIDYKVEYYGEEDNNRNIDIEILDKNKNVIKRIWYYYGKNKYDDHCQFVAQDEYNEQGKLFRRLDYNKDNLEVITYVN